MAAPHVTGATALLLQSFPTATPAQVRFVMFLLTTKFVVTNAQSANSHLLYQVL